MSDDLVTTRLRIGTPSPEHPDWEVTWVQNLRAHFKEGMFTKNVFPEWNDIFLGNVNSLLLAATEAADHIEAQEKLIQEMREALNEIRELNLENADENGHRWANSDMINQTVVFTLSKAKSQQEGETE